jgi:hypothetical protein
MSKFGRNNATGRSSGKLDAQERKLMGPPPNVPWVYIPRDLLMSDAWRGMSVHCRKFIDFLMIEHCNHAGRENGKLQATYDQLSASGLARKRIASAIREAVDRGLVDVTRRGGLYGAVAHRTTSRYRLTWIGTLVPACGPTNEWQRFKRKTNSPHPPVGTVRTTNIQRKVA